MESKFAKIDGINIHYREKGDGPVLVLLHPSPRSSKMMEPLMHLLADQFTVIAPDTPGYGFSSPLPERANSLYDYVPYLRKLFTQITGKPIILYGNATGAQLAIAYSLLHSENIQHLYLDNAAHFDEAECTVLLESYFPDFAPQADGSHLPVIWQHVCESCLYFPWYAKQEQNRIAAQLPAAAAIQAIVNDYIAAGENYADAYTAAFKHERAEKVQQLKCNATIFEWQGSPLLKHIQKLLSYPLPQNIKKAVTPVNNKERYEAMKKEMALSLNKKA